MANHSFFTIQGPSEGTFKDRGSRFLAFAYPVSSEDQVKNHLQALRKRFFDARHQGYAYILGADQRRFRAFDDGEPNHSTGDPILGQIRSRKLTNVLVVVVRYFGGTKLGVSGLIQAYRSAAAEALTRAVVVEQEVTADIRLEFPFDATPAVMKLVKDHDLRIVEPEYSDKTVMTVRVPLRERSAVTARLELLRATGTGIEWSVGIDSSG